MVASQLSIDILKERMISLAQAAKLFPPARRGRPVTPNAIWRWVSTGVRLASGTVVRLEAVKVSGRWLTSEEAVVRFIAAQQPVDTAASEGAGARATRGNAQAADEALQQLGI